MGVRKNALQVFIPKFGLEGAIQLGASAGSGRPGRTRTQPAEQQISADIEVTYDEAHCSLRVCTRAACASGTGSTFAAAASHEFHLFDELLVQVSVTTVSLQHQRLSLRLVSPHILGFSVPPAPVTLSASTPKTPRLG